jgi:hypothetical protein
MRTGVPLLLALLALPACGARTAAPEPGPDDFAQGARGKITQAIGDFQCCPSHGEILPLATTVLAIAGKVQLVPAGPYSVTLPPREALDVAASATSGVDGMYRMGLAPGVYTLLADIDGELVLDSFTSDDFASWSTIEPGQWVTVDIEDNSHATS